MEKSVKRTVKFFAALICLAIVSACSALAFGINASAAGNEVSAKDFYYKELKNSPLAQRFYGVIDEMAQNGHFKNGTNEYDLISSGTLSTAEADAYLDGKSPQVVVALGAARDAFYMDHPDLFYADVYKLYLSAGSQNGNTVAFLGTGAADNYYADNTVKSSTEVAEAVEKYEAAIGKVVDLAKAAGDDAVSRIKAVNKYLAENTEYDYGARNNLISGLVEYDGYVNTAYGPLVNGKALCGGYSRAFKAVMDRLDIPCVLIQGNLFSGKQVPGYASGMAPHMWNAVMIDGLWYGVDVTQNSGAVDPETYLLVGDDFLSRTHFTDGVISSSGFELKYPVLRSLDYGVNADANGFGYKDSGTIDGTTFGYKETDSSGGEMRALNLGVNYEGKSAKTLKEENKYLSARYIKEDGTIPYGWFSLAATEDMFGGLTFGDYTLVMLSATEYGVQFAVFDFPTEAGQVYYDDSKISSANVIAMSDIYKNQGYDSGFSYPPYVKRVTPDEKGMMKSFDPLEVSLEYSEKLVPADGSELNDGFKVEIDVFGSVHGNMNAYTIVENISYDYDSATVKFTFTPSKTYNHNCEMYTFVPRNLVGEDSNKSPEAGGYLTFKMKQVVCPKIFNDGRLYMQVFGQPKFVCADDASLTDFADGNGQPIVGNQRSQLMLVVNEPNKKEQADMKDKLLSDTALGLEESDIKSSSTYQIDLQMCGVVQKVPNGSFMKVGFGFPDGYDYGQAAQDGVTFTVYHYKRDAGGVIIGVEEVPCVITEYGILATVESFSPFMICAVNADKVAAGKRIYAYTEGSGGSINNQKITAVQSGQSVTYTLTPDDGYVLNSALLNGKDVSGDITNGRITLTYDKLADNNELEITFVSERVKTYRETNNLQIASPKYTVTQADMISAVLPELTPAKKKIGPGGIAAAIIVPIVVIAIAVGLAVYFITKKKGGNDGGKGGNKKTSDKKANVKPAASTARPTNATRPVSTAAGSGSTRPVNTTRPATVARPANTARPTTAARPANTTRPTTTSRPTSTTRPTSSASRPTNPARPTDNDPRRKG